MASRDLDQQDALPLPPAAASATETQANDSPSVAAVPCPHIFGFFAPPNPSLCTLCNNTSILADAPAPSSVNRNVEPPSSSRSFRMKNPFIDHISPDPNASPSSLSRPSCPDFFSRTSFRIKKPSGDLPSDPPVPPSSWSFAVPKFFPIGEHSGTEGDVITEEGSSFFRTRRNCNSRSEASELVSSQPPVTQRSCPSPLPDPSIIVPLEIDFPPAETLYSLSRAKPLPTPKPQVSASLENVFPVPESALGSANSLPVPVAVATPSPAGAAFKRKDRCHSCRKRLCLGATFKCRCGDIFCSLHRFPDQHTCTFDLKALDRQLISKANPVVKADKLQNRI